MATRDYVGDGVTVRWDSDRCIHSGVCTRTLPAVFRPLEQPWVVVTAASAADVEAAVALCPSGALTSRRPDVAGPPAATEPSNEPSAESSDTPSAEPATSAQPVTDPATAAPVVTITPTENGPLEVVGPVTLVAADGTTLRRGEKFYLCRCGHSRTKPYCDGSHRREAFEDPGLGPQR